MLDIAVDWIKALFMYTGEDGRGAILESFLVKLKHLKNTRELSVQIVGMSATVGNLKEIGAFLDAELFTDQWRPVVLKEYVKVGKEILEVGKQTALEVGERLRHVRNIDAEKYSRAMKQVSFFSI